MYRMRVLRLREGSKHKPNIYASHRSIDCDLRSASSLQDQTSLVPAVRHASPALQDELCFEPPPDFGALPTAYPSGPLRTSSITSSPLMSLNMETWAFEPPPESRARPPHLTLSARVRKEGPILSTSNSPDVRRTQTSSHAQQPYTIPSEHSSRLTAPVGSFHQIRRTPAEHPPRPSGSGLTNTFYQAEPLNSPMGRGATNTSSQFKRTSAQSLRRTSSFEGTSKGSPVEHSSMRRTLLRARRPSVENSPRASSSAHTLHHIQEFPVEDSPAATVPESPAQLEEFRWNWIFSFNSARVTKILSPIRQRVQILPISVIFANIMF